MAKKKEKIEKETVEEKSEEGKILPDHFDFAEISKSSIVDVEFPLNVYAKDAGDNILTEFNDEIDILDETKTISPSKISLHKGIWKGNVLVKTGHNKNKIKAIYNDIISYSSEFKVLDRKWYTLQVMSGHEKKIKEQLEREIIVNELENKIFQVLVPSEEIVEMKGGKKKTKNRLFFPGYILIEMILDSETKYVVENTSGVIRFIGSTNKPEAVHQGEIERIKGKVKEGESRESLDVPFIIDDVVKVVDGPFNEFIGVVKDINLEKKKVKVMVSIFGRETPVELDFLQVVLEKK